MIRRCGLCFLRKEGVLCFFGASFWGFRMIFRVAFKTVFRRLFGRAVFRGELTDVVGQEVLVGITW